MTLVSLPLPPRARSGFTLVETLVVVALIASLALFAVPSFVAWHMRDQVDAQAHAMVATLSYARSEALRRGVRVTVCRIDTLRHCLAVGSACGSGVSDWSCGWAVMADEGSSAPPALLRLQTGVAAVRVTGLLTNLTFTPPAGLAIGGFRSFEFAPRAASQAMRGDGWRRCIRIASGGRARIADGGCGAAS
ncbi:GspH/FimT family pseudopilin [Paraburkholderia sp.]|uniref:GspH/FimT family pseudopilin n=1 Tax=Paraburkholderia sp. TaxID=1926495 RepID=UPI003D6F556D